MRGKLLLLSAAIGLAVWPEPGSAVVISDLSFDSLPSAQGWTHESSTGTSETGVWSVDGTTLTLNTLGMGDTESFYVLDDALTPGLPVSISLRARVLESEGDSFAFGLVVNLAGEGVLLFMTSDLLRWDGVVAFDSTEFHDYRIEFSPGTDPLLFVDDAPFGSAARAATSGTNSIAFGEAVPTDSNTRVEITRLSITQVPEPSTSLLLGAGLIALAHGRRLRQTETHAHALGPMDPAEVAGTSAGAPPGRSATGRASSRAGR